MDWCGAQKNVIRRPGGGFIPLLCHAEHLRTACFYLADVAHGFIKKPFAAGEGRYEGARLDQRDRAVLELARGICFRMDIADLLELERGFQRHRIIEIAADKIGMVQVAEPLGELLNRRSLIKHLLDFSGSAISSLSAWRSASVSILPSASAI